MCPPRLFKHLVERCDRAFRRLERFWIDAIAPLASVKFAKTFIAE
ncbi:hypothetical protein [Funiculus sociatus]